MTLFERYLTLWFFLCMVVVVLLGLALPNVTDLVRSLEFGHGSHINLVIMLLIWLMIYPMMLKIDFASIKDAGHAPKGLLVTLLVNWVVKSFSMALLGYVFLRHFFACGRSFCASHSF